MSDILLKDVPGYAYVRFDGGIHALKDRDFRNVSMLLFRAANTQHTVSFPLEITTYNTIATNQGRGCLTIDQSTSFHRRFDSEKEAMAVLKDWTLNPS